MAITVGVATLALAPAASASTASSWTGLDPTMPNWSQTNNWSGGIVPSTAGGTLDFPDLPGACDANTSPDTCYVSDDDLGPLIAQELTIDDDQQYFLVPDDGGEAITLDGNGSGVGLDATPTEATTSDSMSGDPAIAVPIQLGANQSWTIDGGTSPSTAYGLEVDDVTGSADTLGLNFLNGGALYTTVLNTGALTASGSGFLIPEQLGTGGSAVDAQLPTAGATLNGGASLLVESPGTTSGPLNVSGSENSQPSLGIGQGGSPDATLTVNGAVTLDEWTNAYFDIDGNGTTAGTDFSALNATGTVALGGATLYLSQGLNTSAGCTALTPGDSFPVISATGSLSGELTYFDTSGNFDVLQPGSASAPVPVTLPSSGCPSGTATADAILNYGAHAITATIVAAPAAGAQAPSISGSPIVGQTLSATGNGSWTGSPTPTYADQWLACSSSCTPIAGATGSTFKLTTAQVGDQIKLQVTATNSLGSAVADSNAVGPVTAASTTTTTTTTTTNSAPTAAQIKSALGGIGHPSGKKAIAALLKSGKFKTGFHAPSGGTLNITWTTTVTTGKGKHKKHRTVTIATGTTLTGGRGTLQVIIHLTGAGKQLLKGKESGLATVSTEKFRPGGARWTSLVKRFSL